MYIVATGPGNPKMITLEAVETLKKCVKTYGWKSVIDRIRQYTHGEVEHLTYENQEAKLAEAAQLAQTQDVCIATHGDPTVSDWELLQRIKKLQVPHAVIHGVSSLNVALGRLGLDAADVIFATLHAANPRDLTEVEPVLKTRVLVAFPPPTPDGPTQLAKTLVERGMAKCRATVLQDLTLPTEKTWQGTVEQLAATQERYSTLTAVAIDCRV